MKYFYVSEHIELNLLRPGMCSSLLESWSSCKTASTTGIIMAVVAVLLIHMDKNHVGSMKPIISLQKHKLMHLCGSIKHFI